MIYKASSSDMMDIFNNAKSEIEKTNANIEILKNNISDKINILTNEYEYLLQAIVDINNKQKEGNISDRIVFSKSDELYGEYDIYGTTVHPKLSKTPKNIFNYIGSNGAVFKNNCTVYVNNVIDDDYKYILMHDTINNKKTFIKEYDEENLKLEFVVTDMGLGDTNMNMIEIAPFMSGSFDINNISIYVYNAGDGELSQILTNIKSVSKSRYIFTDAIKMHKITIDIKLKYRNSNNKYIFGLQHLYFLKANFVSDSNIIFKIDKHDYISYIYDDASIHTQYGDFDVSFISEEAEVYREYNNGVLSHQINFSTNINPEYISSNTKTLYVKMPINTSLISILPKIDTKS